jgi:hypothetical protein
LTNRKDPDPEPETLKQNYGFGSGSRRPIIISKPPDPDQTTLGEAEKGRKEDK